MMLRSSSTPVLGSLLSSFSESPNNNNHHHYQPEITLTTTPNKHPPLPPTHNKLSLHQTSGSHNFTTFSCNSSPISPSIYTTGFRRAQSEGNLETLANSSNNNADDFSFFNPPKKFSSRINSSFLETIPSFSFHNSRNRYEDEFSNEEEEESYHCGDMNMERKNIMGFNGEMRYENEYGNVVLKDQIGETCPQMYLTRGFGVDTGFVGGGGGGGSGNFPQVAFGKDGGGGGDSHGVEEHYKRMVNENPGNPLFMRNYAQFLYQSKQDLQGAEEYYSRATLADPNDGEILSQYAKLLWELHHDKDRATGYFDRAVRSASEDSHVHAAYASFLWEIEEDEDEDHVPKDSYDMQPLLHKGATASASA